MSADTTLGEIYINEKRLNDGSVKTSLSGWQIDQAPHVFQVPATVKLGASMLVALRMKLTSSDTNGDSSDERKGGVLLDNSVIFTQSGDNGWKCVLAGTKQGIVTAKWFTSSGDVDSTWPDAVQSSPKDVQLPKTFPNPSNKKAQWIRATASLNDRHVYCRGYINGILISLP